MAIGDLLGSEGRHSIYRRLLEVAPDALIVTDRDGKILLWNGGAEALYGYSGADALGRLIHELLNTGGRPDTDGGVLEATSRDGRQVVVSARQVVAEDDGGRTLVLHVHRPVAEDRTPKQAPPDSDGEFRSIFELAAVGVAQGDAESGRILRVNPRYCEITGYSEAELIGRPFHDLTHPDDCAQDLEAIGSVVAGQAVEWRSEKRYIRKDGSVRWVLVTGRLVAGAAGQPPRTIAIIQDIDDRKQAEDALRESERALRGSERRAREHAEDLSALMEAVPAIIFIAHDAEARLITGSRAARELLRMGSAANLSKTPAGGSGPTHFKVYKDGVELSPEELPVQQAARGIELHDFDEEVRFENGESVYLFGNAMPLRDENGRPRGAVSAFVDITARKRAELALREADRRKDEFLAMLAHELRNPLAPIRTAVQVMRRLSPPDSQLQEMRDTIDRQVTHLARLVDDLLDVSRITQNKITLQRERLELVTVVGRAVETARPLVDARRHRLVVSLAPAPVRIEGDLTRLAQAIANLLNNAAKYTDEGGTILVSAERAGPEVVVSVKDDGAGIARDVLPHVFDLFTQADRSLERSQGGLGIGLTLVRRLVEMHGGRVEALSAGSGKGAEFRIYLPVLAEDAPADATPSPIPSPAAAGQALRVLVVDDSVDSAETLALFLGMYGHETSIAHNGYAALEAVRTFRPHAVVLDIGLPGLDGYEVAQRLRQMPEGRKALVVALTGYGQPEDRRTALAAGCNEHLTKPVDPERLASLITDLVREPGA